MPRLPLIAPLVLAAVLSACGGGGGGEGAAAATPPPSPAPVGTERFVGNDELLWAEEEKQAQLVEGSLDLEIYCDGSIEHNVLLEGVEGELAYCAGGEVGSGEVDVDPGTYTFYCSIPGHRAAGMEGTITLEG